MIIAVTEQYHDYQPTQYFLDTNRLDPKNYVDQQIANCIKSKLPKCFIDATSNNRHITGEEPMVSESAKVNSGPAERMLMLTIQFE